jgi:hypothetical protein
MLAVPTETPDTTPAGETVALFGSDVLQAKLRGSTRPDLSFALAESCSVAVGTRVPDVADRTTTSVVGVGGPTGPSPPQDPRSQQRAKNPRRLEIRLISKCLFAM